ncbi:MAG: nicotinamide-nucleotide amidohydrolase family protein [Alphaproteobacteria bacterium]|nr:nicotinamide-nucleotide amidohydrolase family protein [Alphaproteobacteria bacterium]
MDTVTLLGKAEALLAAARAKRLKLAAAESCTGGMLMACLTELSGASEVVDCGFVTYSNAAKHELLGVPFELIEEYGAVSEPVARAMAEGALRNSHADIAAAITGVAGPTGGTADKPVGLVHFAAARRGRETVSESRRFGDLGRSVVRLRSVETALELMQSLV